MPHDASGHVEVEDLEDLLVLLVAERVCHQRETGRIKPGPLLVGRVHPLDLRVGAHLVQVVLVTGHR